MNDLQILLDLAKQAHRDEILAARPKRHDSDKCYKCQTILKVDKASEDAWADGEMLVIYRP